MRTERVRGGGDHETLASAENEHIEEHIIAVAPEDVFDDMPTPTSMVSEPTLASIEIEPTPASIESGPTTASIERERRLTDPDSAAPASSASTPERRTVCEALGLEDH